MPQCQPSSSSIRSCSNIVNKKVVTKAAAKARAVASLNAQHNRLQQLPKPLRQQRIPPQPQQLPIQQRATVASPTARVEPKVSKEPQQQHRVTNPDRGAVNATVSTSPYSAPSCSVGTVRSMAMQ